MVDALSNRTTFDYDLRNRLTMVTYPDLTHTDFAYDTRGRRTSVTDQNGKVTAYAYDDADRLTSVTDAAQNVTGYGYDTLNRLTTLNSGLAGQFTFGYDELNRRTSLSRPNGVVTSYSYDNLSRLLSVLHKRGGTTVIDGATYTLDNAGNRISKTNQLTGTEESYTYDAIYQLTQVTQQVNGTPTTTESYTYDNVGNRTSSLNIPNYTVNESNQLTSTTNAAYTYDANGNTLTKTDASGTTTYNWDYENRLTSVVLPGTGGTVSFRYDPFGRRIQKTSSRGIINYAYDELFIVEEFSSGVVANRYLQSLDIDQPLAVVVGSTPYYYEADGVHSITSLTDQLGTFSETYSYDSGGMSTTISGNIVQPFRYTGREWDQATEIYNYRARSYDPAVGRFSSEDPLGFASEINFFQYVENNPINLIDPAGESGSRPGGPYHPPAGVSTKCRPDDSCPSIIGKLWLLRRMIASHTGWDRNVPSPRGGVRHYMEISDLWIQYANCEALYQKKCTKPECQKAKEASPEEKQRNIDALKRGLAVAAGAAAAALAPELLPITLPQLRPTFVH